jgi:hypothetical protein
MLKTAILVAITLWIRISGVRRTTIVLGVGAAYLCERKLIIRNNLIKPYP